MRAMKKSRILSTIALLFAVCVVSIPARAEYGGGTGESDNPYLIYNAKELNSIGAEPNDWDKHFMLMADIDMSGYTEKDFNVIGYCADLDSPDNVPFTGTFYGNCHIIENLTVEGKNYLGMFSQLGSGAEVRDLGLIDIKISGSGDYIGGLVGYNDGGSISNCYTTGAVSGKDFVGGLTGWNSGQITNCYSTSRVIGNVVVGGLVGLNCDGGVDNSFWDIEASGQLTSDGGTGLSEAEMKTAAFFLNAGWDFVDETNNGTDDTWWILEGQDYPQLWCEPIEDNTFVLNNLIIGGQTGDEDEEEDQEEETTTIEVSLPTSTSSESFTEQFSSSLDVFDLSYKSVMFTPTTDGSYYALFVQDISSLPTNPAGGTRIDLDDDDYTNVYLNDPNKAVYIFGYRYYRFFVGSNGYITFTRGDTSRSKSLSSHFNTKRISALFSDFDPTKGGKISWKEATDHVAVTWENISEFTPTNSNTFQVELYFDGRIRLAWLDIGAKIGIVGLSRGTGVPSNFQETDFSEITTTPGPGTDPGTPGGGNSDRRNRKK
ncbi:MAG: hypothetical protein JW715_16175 [Sedimentisphaerales bacterium]|nr:hypothetical protein [Sedimentisphaerales bacterium]